MKKLAYGKLILLVLSITSGLAQASGYSTLKEIVGANGELTTFVVDKSKCEFTQAPERWALVFSFLNIHNRIQTFVTKVGMSAEECDSALSEIKGKGVSCQQLGQFCGTIGSEYRTTLVNGKDDYTLVKNVLNSKTKKVETFLVREY